MAALVSPRTFGVELVDLVTRQSQKSIPTILKRLILALQRKGTFNIAIRAQNKAFSRVISRGRDFIAHFSTIIDTIFGKGLGTEGLFRKVPSQDEVQVTKRLIENGACGSECRESRFSFLSHAILFRVINYVGFTGFCTFFCLRLPKHSFAFLDSTLKKNWLVQTKRAR